MRVAALLLGLLAAAPVAAGGPERVVSMNLCTDQMAMLLAGPGQLVSVSFLARDPESAVLWREAGAFPVNHGLAEEIFPLKPDLVLAGTYTSRATVEMLRRLGLRVEEFPLEASFADIRANLSRMGALLGREEAAAEAVAALDRALAEARASEGARRPRAAPYHAAGYTSGAGTLADEIVAAAGLGNIAAERGLRGMTRLPLEVLAVEAPELLIVPPPSKGESLATAVPEHPAFAAARTAAGEAAVTGPSWTCGGPFTALAVRALAEARARLTGDRG